MRTIIVFALLVLPAVDVAAAGTPPPAWTHTRPLTPGAAELLADAARRSVIIRTLLENLEQTDVVVYLSDSMTGSDEEPQAYLTFLSQGGGIRYLLVRVASSWFPPTAAIPPLGHELQHAVEVAGAPEVQDAASMAQLYRRIGWEGRTGRFESDRARAVGVLVRNQLAGHQR
jgi:hypothetical protein